MNSLRKILCVVLVIAMLMTGIVFVVGADEAVASTEPTVTSTPYSSGTDTFNASNWADASNQLVGLSWTSSGTYSNPEEVVNAHIVTEAGSSDSYVALVSKGDSKGTHVQYLVTAGATSNWVKMSNQHYYVIELDIATQSTLHTNLQVTPVHRKSDGTDTSMFGTSVKFSKYVSELDGDWAHVSIVGRVDVSENVNKQYIYVNGVLAGEQNGAVNADNFTGGVTPENFDSGNGLYVQGIRIEIPGASDIFADQSAMLDNISRRDYSAADATANGLAEIVAAGNSGDLSEWSGYNASNRAGTSLADIATVDGVKYNNSNDISNVLFGNGTHEVSILGNNVAPITVACDATIKTNGYSPVLAYLDGATVNEADGVITVDAPYVVPVTHTPMSSNSAAYTSETLAAIKYPAEDNLFYSVTSQYLDAVSNAAPNANTHMQQYVTSIHGVDNTYATYMVTRDITLDMIDHHTHTNYEVRETDGSLAWAALKSGSLAADGTDTRQYVVFEWDMYTESTMPYAMYIGITTRNSAGSNKGGTSFYLDNYQTDVNIQSQLPVGEWYHMTLVGDVQTNTLYVYINNKYVFTRTNGITNDKTILEDGTARLYGPRLNIASSPLDTVYARSGSYKQTAGASFSTDNYYARRLTGSEAGNLASLIGADDISNWSENVYNDEYVETYMPKAIAAVNVDGTDYTSVANASAALLGNSTKNVQILRSVSGLVIGCNAVIETNGIEFVEGTNYTVVEGATQSWNGTVLTVKVPYQPNASYTELTGAGGSLKGVVDATVSGNILASAAGSIMIPNNGDNSKLVADDDAQRLIPYLVNTADGDSYYMIVPDESTYYGEYTENPYIYIENYSIKDDSNKLSANGYYVIDLDVYTESNYITNISIAPTNRNTPTGSGFPFGDGFTIGNFAANDDGWVHLTYVGDVSANKSHVYVDGVYAGTTGVAVRSGYNTIEDGVYAVGFRINLPAKQNVLPGQMIAFRGATERVFASDEAAGGLAAAIEAGSLAGWSGNIAGYQGKAPAIATVDGVEYNNTTSASEALAGTDATEVEFTRSFQGTVTVDAPVSITTHGFGNIDVVQSTTSYGEGDEKVTIVGSYIVSTDADGNYDVVAITPDNADSNASLITWIIDEEAGIYDNVYYVYGQNIEYLGDNAIIANGNYIAGGNLTTFNGWSYLDSEGTPMVDDAGAPVTSLGVASEAVVYAVGMADYSITEGTDISIG
ncbi:MAG: hypothetical protein IJX38_00650, partial [Clostridia bacterium]|nr:hypothetical protein [Clostridia bacterium]